MSAYPASMIAVAAFCRIVLWLEKKLRRHRRAIAAPMFIYLSWKYTIFGLRGLRVGRRGRLRLLPPSVVSLFHMPKEVPTSRSRRFPREKARQTETTEGARRRKGVRAISNLRNLSLLHPPLSSVLVSKITYKYNDSVTAAQRPFLSYHYHQTTSPPPCSND